MKNCRAKCGFREQGKEHYDTIQVILQFGGGCAKEINESSGTFSLTIYPLISIVYSFKVRGDSKQEEIRTHLNSSDLVSY